MPVQVRGDSRSHLILAALRTVAMFLTQAGAAYKSTLVLGGGRGGADRGSRAALRLPSHGSKVYLPAGTLVLSYSCTLRPPELNTEGGSGLRPGRIP